MQLCLHTKLRPVSHPPPSKTYPPSACFMSSGRQISYHLASMKVLTFSSHHCNSQSSLSNCQRLLHVPLCRYCESTSTFYPPAPKTIMPVLVKPSTLPVHQQLSQPQLKSFIVLNHYLWSLTSSPPTSTMCCLSQSPYPHISTKILSLCQPSQSLQTC